MYKIIVFVLIALLLYFLVPPHTDSYIAPVEPKKPPTVQEYAKSKVGVQWPYFNAIIERESRWNSKAQNPKSTAYGLGQFLNSTWATVGCEKTSDPYIQIDCTIKYIDKNYTTSENALAFHKKNNWY